MIPRFGAALAALRALLLVGLLSSAPAGVAGAAAPALELVGADQAETLELSLERARGDAAGHGRDRERVQRRHGQLSRAAGARRAGQLGLDQLETVRFIAANDYYVDIPTEDFRDYDAILAMEADGEQLSRREKGPLWLMYPISDHSALRDPIYLRRLIWQVVRIEAL